MNERKTVKRWEKTSVQNLVRSQSGVYYARVCIGKGQKWKSLKTSHLQVAKARLRDHLAEHAEQVETQAALVTGKLSLKEAAELHLQKLQEDRTLKPATKHYWAQVVKALLKSWPTASERDVRSITAKDCQDWAKRLAKTASSTRFNNTVAALAHIMDMAIEAGARHNNPARLIKRVKVLPKQLHLPSREAFLAIVENIRTAGAWCSRDCADLVQFLAFTGCRTGEAAQVEWRDVEFDRGELVVRGDPETGTKNWTIRRVPLIPEAHKLLERMRSERADEPATAKVLRVNEAQKAIDSAAVKAGTPRITHHDLRHLFATACIESGVDIPTVSRWLGHKDGGALAMKTYGHLRNEHSKAQAAKVSFAPATAAPSNVVPFQPETAAS